MPVVHVIFVLALLGAALAVRSAGSAPILYFVSYERVTDRVRLHRWAGNRLLILTAFAFVVAAFAWARQDFALVLLFLQIFLVFVAAVALAAGSSKFLKAPGARAA